MRASGPEIAMTYVPELTQQRDPDSHLTIRQDSRLTARAIREGWIPKDWDCDKPIDEIKKRAEDEAVATVADKALLGTVSLLDSGDPKAISLGVAAVLAMRAQNLKRHERPRRKRQPIVMLAGSQAVIVQGDVDGAKQRAMAIIGQRSDDGGGS